MSVEKIKNSYLKNGGSHKNPKKKTYIYFLSLELGNMANVFYRF
jgi:hypothetical protein